MFVRNISETDIHKILEKLQLHAEVTQHGKELHLNPKRNEAAVRIAPKGANWYLYDYGVHKGRAWSTFGNVHHDPDVTEYLQSTVTLSNADWYDLTMAILKHGGIVKVGTDKFHSVAEYNTWCEQNDRQELIDAERELRVEIQMEALA